MSAEARSLLLTATDLTKAEWAVLLTGARYKRWSHGDRVVRLGEHVDGLLQVASGTLRVEVAIPGRPQVQVIGRLHAGNVLGELHFLLGTSSHVTAIVESEEAATIRMPSGTLRDLFSKRRVLAGKFYYFLAVCAPLMGS